MVPREGLRSPARRHADTHDCRNTRGHEVEGRACDPGTRARRSALRGGRQWQMTRLGTPRRPVPLSRGGVLRSEEHTSELQSLMRISYAVFCLKKNNIKSIHISYTSIH